MTNNNKENERKNILLVGSWAKEQITVENIKKNSVYNVFIYMDTKNPAIISMVDGYKIGNFYDIESMVNYAKEIGVHLVIITTASPLSKGIVDQLDSEDVPVFGPHKSAARLEWDKAFTRELLKKHIPLSTPSFEIFNGIDEAVAYAESFDWKVAVKPVGLTEGLGVRVYGDQLKNSGAVQSYIKNILSDRQDGEPKAIIEEKLIGEEFTLQCFVNDNLILPTPLVQDFKKLLPGELGVNTASMGSYSDYNKVLPFLEEEDYQRALHIMRQTLAAFKDETGEVCRGFLYGQFMITTDGLKLIEYNFRPGDPEWMNTVILLKNNIADVIFELLEGKTPALKFDKKATVCKYIVPPKYPAKLNEVLDVSLDEPNIALTGAKTYHSCGVDDNNQLNVGLERGIAFIAKADTISEANEIVEKAISKVKGKFYYRFDIGTEALISSKVLRVKNAREKGLILRRSDEYEFMEVYNFVSQCDGLEIYSPHFYKIMLRYFRTSSFIAEYNNDIIGWVLGFHSQIRSDTYFLWQIGISPDHQGHGLGKILLNYVEKEVNLLGCSRVELTIDPENIPSQKLFEKLDYSIASEKEGDTILVNKKNAVRDYYSPGRHFIVYEKLLKKKPAYHS